MADNLSVMRTEAILEIEKYLKDGKKIQKQLSLLENGTLKLETKTQAYNRSVLDQVSAHKAAAAATKRQERELDKSAKTTARALIEGRKEVKVLQTLANGTQRWENKLQTSNRKVLEQNRALKALTKETEKAARATQKKTSFIGRMTTAFIGADLAVRGIIAGFRAMKEASKFVMQAAIDNEMFEASLLAVTDSAGEAGAQLKRIREFAAASPLETKDMVDAFIKLKAIGIPAAFEVTKAVGNIGLVFNKSLDEVTAGFIGLEKKTLRRLGVEIDRTGSKAVLVSGNMRIETEKTDSAIRDGLLKVWAERFPDAMEIAGKTTKAKLAVMRSEFWELAVAISDGPNSALKKSVEWVTSLAKAVRKEFAPGSLSIDEQIALQGEKIVGILNRIAEKKDQLFGLSGGMGELLENDLRAEREKLSLLKKQKDEQKSILDAAKKKEVSEQASLEAQKAAADFAKVKADLDKKYEGKGGGMEKDREAAGKARIAHEQNLNQLELDLREVKFQGLKDSYIKEFDLLGIEYQKKLDAHRGNLEAMALIDIEFDEKKKQLEESQIERESRVAQELKDKKLAASSQFFNGLSALAAEGAKKNKKMAIIAKGTAMADAVVNTYGAANKALNSGVPFPFNVAAMIGVIGMGLANVSQISNQKFAGGGIVGGNSYSGDNVPASVNSGEMILNKQQQANLFNQANGGGGSSKFQFNIYGGATSQAIGQIRNIAYELEQAERNGSLDYFKSKLGLARA